MFIAFQQHQQIRFGVPGKGYSTNQIDQDVFAYLPLLSTLYKI